MNSIKEIYISAGTNQSTNSLVVCEEEDAFVVASDSEIVFTTFEKDLLHSKRKIASRQHSHPIKCLKKCKRRNAEREHFVTGGADGRVILWRKSPDFGLIAIFATPRSSSIIGIVGGTVNGTAIKLFSSSVAGSSSQILIQYLGVKEANQIESKAQQILELPGKAFALSVDFSTINDCELMAIGSSNRSIELFTFDRKEFLHRLSIPAHSDWVDSLAFKDLTSHSMLASSSQDRLIKLWKIQLETPSEDVEELTVTRNRFSGFDSNGKEIKLCLHVEAVLNGHDDWIHSVSWDSAGKQLISASSDKTVIVWREDEASGLWTDSVRMGLVGGQAAGFYMADFSADGRMIFASTYYGAVHAWRVNDEDCFQWDALTVPGNGHPSVVTDLSWEPTNGQYLVTVGADQTTRIHAQLKDTATWIEVARPQVHGHDLQCVVTIDPARFVSGAEEKIFRAFNAPETFVNTLETLTGIDKNQLFAGCQLSGYGARVPALGLSNKAIEGRSSDTAEEKNLNDDQDGETHWEETAFVANPTTLNVAPTEDILMQNTLWPEVHKLYGHGYEVYAVAVNPNGKLLATACKASHPDHAAILIWSTNDWTQRGQVKDGHQLTVTQIEWSPDGKWLLSVSRDRTAIIYKEADGNVDGYSWSAVWKSKTEHSRIIWSCAWLNDSAHFITASRDHKLILWRWQDEQAVVEVAAKMSQPITAVGVSRSEDLSKAKIVTGMQDGRLLLFSFDVEAKRFIQCGEVGGDRVAGIESPISRIRFRPGESKSPVFAVAGSDFKVRIFQILN